MLSGDLIIEVKNLRKKFGQQLVVDDISLQVKRGEIFGFLGPNGSGKTTTIRMLCGLLLPDGGGGTCLGYDILTESQTIKKYVGYVSQYFSLYKSLTVYENILLMAELNDILNKKQKVQEVIETMNLSPYRDRLAGRLSGGWQQRLSLACSLVREPFLLLLDEPTASMDPKARSEFWEIMHILAQEGTTILLSSHNIEEIAQSHNIAYIHYGKLLLSGSLQDVITYVNLSSWRTRGPNLNLLAKQLKVTPGVEQVVSHYDTLHVSSRDAKALRLAIDPFLKLESYSWEPYDTTLDDVIIWLSANKKVVDLGNKLTKKDT